MTIDPPIDYVLRYLAYKLPELVVVAGIVGLVWLTELSADTFSVRWDTCLQIEETSEVTFLVMADNGARLYLDGEQVLDGWKALGRKPKASKSLTLQPGEHHLRLEFYDRRGDAVVQLMASFDGEKPENIPPSLLRYPGDELSDPVCGKGG